MCTKQEFVEIADNVWEYGANFPVKEVPPI